MPKYLYRCDQCGHELEMIHPVITPKEVAPLCCSHNMDRFPNTPNVMAKSETFYIRTENAYINSCCNEMQFLYICRKCEVHMGCYYCEFDLLKPHDECGVS